MLTRKLAFYLMWGFIVSVSAHDGCLVLAHRPSMRLIEQNPVGHWLIRAGNDDIWLLLTLKAIGTVAVASFLLVLHSFRPSLAFISCAAVAVFQLGLLMYLYSF